MKGGGGEVRDYGDSAGGRFGGGGSDVEGHKSKVGIDKRGSKVEDK